MSNKKFFSMLGAGFDAYVVSNVNLDLKKKYGKKRQQQIEKVKI